MTVTSIFSNVYNIKFLDCRDIINYTSRYQITYNKILSLIKDNSAWISKKIIKLTLYDNLLEYLDKKYTALVTTIKTKWKKEITSLSDTVLMVVRHMEINKKNERDMANSILIALIIGV